VSAANPEEGSLFSEPFRFQAIRTALHIAWPANTPPQALSEYGSDDQGNAVSYRQQSVCGTPLMRRFQFLFDGHEDPLE
jgi:hypothetical protein